MDPVLLELGPIRLWYYGLAYAMGLLAIDWWVYRRRERLGLDRREVAEFSLMFALGVLLGGRVFDVVFYEWFYYRQHPDQLASLWWGGMATHGVLLGALVAAAIFCRLRNKNLLAIADEVVVPGAVLMALGRVGNHINGEVYGSVTGVGWAMQFPYAEGCRHPAALYDGFKNLLIVLILLYVRRGQRRRGYGVPGLLLAHFVLWYGSLRVFVDLFRDYDSYWLGIGRGQYFNVLMAVIGLLLLVGLRTCARRYPAKGLPGGPLRGAAGIGEVPPFRLWIQRSAFYTLVCLCLLIPSGWTQQVLETFRVSGAPVSPARTGCDAGGTHGERHVGEGGLGGAIQGAERSENGWGRAPY